MVRVRLQPQQSIRAESGSLLYMTDGVTMQAGAGGGQSAMARRVMTGETALIVDFVNTGRREAEVGLSPESPAKVVPLQLAHHGGSIIAQRGAFLCGHSTVQIEIEPSPAQHRVRQQQQQQRQAVQQSACHCLLWPFH